MSQDKLYIEQITTVMDMFSKEYNIPVIMGLQMYDKPKDNTTGKTKYPYVGYTILSTRQVANLRYDTESADNVTQAWREQWEITFSFVAVGMDYYDTIETAHTLSSWIKNVGRKYLSDNNIAYVSATPVSTRDFLLINDYERRQGFDCILRFGRIVEKVIERIETVNVQPGTILNPRN